MIIFSQSLYDQLASVVFQADYPGYRPAVKEAPNGDGRVDAQKRYAHIAPKYGLSNELLFAAYQRAFQDAANWCRYYDLPAPGPDSTLRLLHYPPGARSEDHTDFDLLTLNLWRSDPYALRSNGTPLPGKVHIGELAEHWVDRKATVHWVEARPYDQYSIVFFAVPNHSLRLPDKEVTVGEWIAERISRSRYK